MNEKRRLNLALSMAQPLHRRAWELITAIPEGQRTDAVCQMIVEHGYLGDVQEAVRIAVREVMQELGSPCTALPQQQQNSPEPQGAGDVDADILAFLMDLQKDDEGDDPI